MRLIWGTTLIGILLILPLPLFGAALSDSSFHTSQTAAEKALDSILKRAELDNNQLDNLFKGRGDPSFHANIDYSTFLTRSYLHELKKNEAKMVKEACGGTYQAGEICGYDYSPITCGQDTKTTFVYHTLRQTPSSAMIVSRWPAVTYWMKRSDHWKIDRVRCGKD